MGYLGAGEIVVILVFVVLYAGVLLIPAWMIVKKAGYNPALSLLALVPIVNLVALYVFAFSNWPVNAGAENRPTT
jgi:uncharacterized RDD family membrane protein YckC